MEKKIVVLVHPGLPYRKTVRYGNERAREMGAKLSLLGVVPEFDDCDKVALAIHELAPYDAISGKIEGETVAFMDRTVQFCLDNGITVDTTIKKGTIEDVIKQQAKDVSIRLIVVPAPTNHAHHLPFVDTIRQFAHNMLEYDLRCPVVSVLAT